MTSLRFPSDWILQARDALARLAHHPWALFAVLFAINTLTRPYAGITHDARLYSGQVLNRVEGGTYADDLFFRFGSQDQYSLFSHLAAPLVQILGLPIAFFFIYLISKTLLIWGMIRLVHTLVPNRTASTIALAYCMIVTIHYGGMYVLNVQETFVTPRMLAVALVLISLDFALRARPVVSGAVLLFALAIHPLMAFGGLLVWSAFHVWKHLGLKTLLAGASAVAVVGSGILTYEPLGLRVFGVMDDTWRDSIRHASPFNFPSQWSNDDWWYLAIQIAVTAVIIWKLRGVDADKMRLVVLVLLVAILGAIGAVLAEQLPYALLLQGQPYRAMWLLAFLHLAFASWLFVEWVQDARLVVQLAGCACFAYLCSFDGLMMEMLFPMCVWPIAVLALRGLERQPRDPAWLTHGIQVSLVAGLILWIPYKFLLLGAENDAMQEMHPELRDFVEVYAKNIGPVAVLLALACLLVRFAGAWTPRAASATALTALGAQGLFFSIPETDYYRDHATRYRGDLAEIRAIMDAERGQRGSLPTVYSNLGCLDYIWLDLHAHSFFDWWQAGNFMFRKEMAEEGQRRACLVAAFELERFRKFKHEMTDGEKHLVGRFFKVHFDSVRLSDEDLRRVVREPGLDYIVIEQEFDGLYASRHGRLYLYRCSDVRTALGESVHGSGEAIASR